MVFNRLMVPLLKVNWQTPSIDYSLSGNDAEVLFLIENENLSVFTFDGLKRRTGFHSETLSRILHRLEEEGIIEKCSEGYRVTPKITELKLHRYKAETNTSSLIQTFLPSDLMIQQLILQLKGKWFGMLRWLGISEDNQGITLKWVTEDGGIQIAANINGSALNIEAKFLTNNNLNTALKAAYQLMTIISKMATSSKAAASSVARHVSCLGDYNMPS